MPSSILGGFVDVVERDPAARLLHPQSARPRQRLFAMVSI
jgi:hypothetical protein